MYERQNPTATPPTVLSLFLDLFLLLFVAVFISRNVKSRGEEVKVPHEVGVVDRVWMGSGQVDLEGVCEIVGVAGDARK